MLSACGVMVLAAAFSPSLAAQSLDYFPLQIGNAWTYRQASPGLNTEDIFKIIVRWGLRRLHG